MAKVFRVEEEGITGRSLGHISLERATSQSGRDDLSNC